MHQSATGKPFYPVLVIPICWSYHHLNIPTNTGKQMPSGVSAMRGWGVGLQSCAHDVLEAEQQRKETDTDASAKQVSIMCYELLHACEARVARALPLQTKPP